jgi:hypothetical protein
MLCGRSQVISFNFDRDAVKSGLISSIANDPKSKLKLNGDDDRNKDDTIDLLRDCINDKNLHFASSWADVYFGNGQDKVYGHVFLDIPGGKGTRFDFIYSEN